MRFGRLTLNGPCVKGDQAAICMDYGQVTPDMLDVHAQNLWQMQNDRATEPVR